MPHLPCLLSRLSLIGAIVLLSPLVVAPAGAETQRQPTLSVAGTAEIAAVPDRATVITGVVSEAESAREALDLNSAALARVIASLKEAGIEERDIATSGFSVQPRYHYPRNRDGEQEPPRLVGYQVINQLTVRVRDLNMLGQVLDGAVTVGANRIEAIAFEVSDADRRLDEARVEAVRDARRKAELYAEAGGFELTRILSMSERGDDVSPPRPMDMARTMQAEAASVPIEAGEQTLTVRVDIVWEIGE